MMKVFHNEKELVFAKTFMISELGTTRVEIPDDDDGPPLLLELVFSETDDGEQKLNGQVVDTHTMRLELNNWSNVLGTTLSELTEVGTYSKKDASGVPRTRQLFFLMGVRKVGSKGQIREINLSMYIGEEASHGDA